MTRAGVLIPRSEPEEPRHPRVTPVEFYDTGQVARVALAQPIEVTTSLGPLPAELVLFHPDGQLKRVFPANGKVHSMWTVEDEAEFVPRLTLNTPAGEVTARFISIAFHQHGALRSLTLWPGEQVTLATPLGPLSVRQGCSFDASGLLQSVEPARPVRVNTPLGPLHAFDPGAVGLNADANSLQFGPDGRVSALTTERDAVMATLADGTSRRFAPSLAPNDCSDACTTGAPLQLRFVGELVKLRLGAVREEFPLSCLSVARPADGRFHLPWVG